MKAKIPVFFSVNDAYVPYLGVAICSMLNNASYKYEYEIVLVNDGSKDKTEPIIKELIGDNNDR